MRFRLRQGIPREFRLELPQGRLALGIRRPGTVSIFLLLLTSCSAETADLFMMRPNSLGQELFAYWPMDEDSGTDVYDKGPQLRKGTLSGSATRTTHAGFGNALHFEAPTDDMTVPGFTQATPDWSVSLWVRLPSQEAFNTDTYLTLISTEVPKGGNGPNSGGGWEMNLGRPMSTTAGVPTTSYLYQFAYWVGPDVGNYMKIESPNAPVNVWTHLVAVVDGSAMTLSLYENGQLWRKLPVTDLIKPTGTTTLFMAAWFGQNRRFTGDLDDVAIYGRVLKAEEVTKLSNGPIPLNALTGVVGGQGGSQP
jgi:hypothetical protein